jgi:hypothetical protein
VKSLVELMRIELAVPDHTTLARRRRRVTVTDFHWPRQRPFDIVIDGTGAGDWAGQSMAQPLSWRKLH